jgi:hypothetical protein
MEGVRLRNGSAATTPSIFERNRTMSKIKSVKQFKERVDGAFETMKTRDEAKACYDFAREEFDAADEE